MKKFSDYYREAAPGLTFCAAHIPRCGISGIKGRWRVESWDSRPSAGVGGRIRIIDFGLSEQDARELVDTLAPRAEVA